MSSGLVFTQPKQDDLGAEDGFLQAWEIFEEVRIDADLVVLSSCDSGIGRDLGGEGLLSLTRAFQFAGARSVMASLWQVVVRGAANLMAGFYRHLRDGSSTADALRQAQLEILGRESPEPDSAGSQRLRGNEFSWAAFQVFGDWQ